MQMDADEARATLERLEERLQREVEDIRRVLEADVPTHVQRAVRGTFERSPLADDLDQAALKGLKEATHALSQQVARDVLAELAQLSAWTWPAGEAFPREPETLRDHPGVAAALDRVEAAVRALLREHGIPAEESDARPAYRMPSYFVAGHFMKSLVATYWRTLADYEELRAAVDDVGHAEQRDRRRARWDDA